MINDFIRTGKIRVINFFLHPPCLPNCFYCRILIGLLLMIANLFMVSAKEIDSDTKIPDNGPNILKILEEAKAKGYAEILDEAESRIADLREEFVAEKDAGKDFANKVALLEDNYIALEFEMWKIEKVNL